MDTFPKTLEYIGLNQPVREEYDIAALEVEGEIPAEIEGSFFRAVPDPAFPPFVEDGGAILSGDGMVSAVRIRDGKAGIAMRYVQTQRHLAEVAAGRALFGKYRNPYTDRPQARGLDRTVANTTPVWHAGRLLLSKEDGRPYRVDPLTLDTIGSHDFGGKLRSQTVTAHPRVDPASGEMYSFGYEAEGLGSTRVSYFIVDRAGELRREQFFDVPYCGLMHDFAITQNYALFPLYPTTCDPGRVKAGGDHWVHELQRESWLGVVPREGSVKDMRWFRGPKGVSCFHIVNAFEDAQGRIHMDQCLADVVGFPFIQRASGLNVAPGDFNGRLERWTVDLSTKQGEVQASVVGPPGDLPMLPARFQGRPHDHAYLLTMNPQRRGPPVFGGPVGAMFDVLLRLDMRGGPPNALALAQGQCFSEPVHVPAQDRSHGGWLLCVVDTQVGPNEFQSALWVLDADNPAAGPLAKAAIPRRQRPQVHGSWVPSLLLGA